MSKTYKWFVLFLFGIIMIAPAIERYNFLHIAPTEGYYVPTERPVFTWEKWFNGQFQDQMTKRLEDKIGFRSWFIRIKNQVDYSLFGITHASNAVVGKNGVLYQDLYIYSAHGEDFVGEFTIKRKIEKCQFVQEELRKRGVFLLVVIAPGKPSVYPEYIPDEFNKRPYKTTNYEIYAREMKKRSINVIDMRQHFIDIKHKVKYPLFTQCGVHWSGYSMTIVADSIFRYLKSKTGYNLTTFDTLPGIVTKTDLRGTDYDIGNALNLIFNINTWDTYYPEVVFDTTSTSLDKPNILCIGDSFNQSFWSFYPFLGKTFGSQSQYWYYNNYITWPDSLADKYIPTLTLDYRKEIEKRNIVMLVMTEENLLSFGFGFIDEAYNVYNRSFNYDAQIADFYTRLKTDSVLYKTIKQQSIDQWTNFDVLCFIKAKAAVNEAGKQIDEMLRKQYEDSVETARRAPMN